MSTLKFPLKHRDPIPADIVVNNPIDADKPRVNLSRPRNGIRSTGVTTAYRYTVLQLFLNAVDGRIAPGAQVNKYPSKENPVPRGALFLL